MGVLNWFEPQLTTHFHISEFDCHDETAVPWNLLGNVQALAENLEIIRAASGNRRIKIISGFRNETYNRLIAKGEDNSFHIKGMAADIKVAGMTPKQVYTLIMSLIAAGKVKNGGVGLYNTFVHYDIGPANRRW